MANDEGVKEQNVTDALLPFRAVATSKSHRVEFDFEYDDPTSIRVRDDAAISVLMEICKAGEPVQLKLRDLRGDAEARVLMQLEGIGFRRSEPDGAVFSLTVLE